MSFNFADYKRIDIPEGRVKQIARASDGLVLWTAGYINQVPLSIDTDGSIYNGTGYIDGYRLNSSGTTSAMAGAAATGYIPATPSDIIRMAGVQWRPQTTGYCYISFFDANFKKLAHINCYSSSAASNGVDNMIAGTILVDDKLAHNITTDENGVTAFDLAYASGASFAYIRISGYGSGADMIVTVNEEIT